jgi:transcriptional regulator with XRE-family HTH domain
MIEISLGQRLHELRDRADLSLRELAKKVGISGPFLSDIELGRRFPSEEILAKLASALNVSLEDLKQYDNREPIADLLTPHTAEHGAAMVNNAPHGTRSKFNRLPLENTGVPLERSRSR